MKEHAEKETATGTGALCQVCKEKASKYTCPGCERKTCSLECVQGMCVFLSRIVRDDVMETQEDDGIYCRAQEAVFMYREEGQDVVCQARGSLAQDFDI
jgi:hypothetical protein